MGRECSFLCKRLSKVSSEKREFDSAICSCELGGNQDIGFGLLKSCLLCLCGSRSFNQNFGDYKRLEIISVMEV